MASDANYGFVDAFLKQHPDVAALINKAKAARWTEARFEAELKNTKWWTTRTDAQRQWDVLSTDNPEEAKRRVAEKQAAITQQAKALGINLSAADLAALARTFVVNGSSDVEIQAALAGRYRIGEAASGQASVTIDDLRAQAQDYGLKLSDGTLQGYVQQVLAGTATPQSLADQMREQAKILYAPIAGALDRGLTVRQYLDPYMQIASAETGVPVDQMDLTDPKWTKAISGTNGQPMTTDEWTSVVRKDPRYGWDKGPVAIQTASQFISQFSRLMGASA